MRIENLTSAGDARPVKVVTIAGKITVLYGCHVVLRDGTNRLAVSAYLAAAGIVLPLA